MKLNETITSSEYYQKEKYTNPEEVVKDGKIVKNNLPESPDPEKETAWRITIDPEYPDQTIICLGVVIQKEVTCTYNVKKATYPSRHYIIYKLSDAQKKALELALSKQVYKWFPLVEKADPVNMSLRRLPDRENPKRKTGLELVTFHYLGPAENFGDKISAVELQELAPGMEMKDEIEKLREENKKLRKELAKKKKKAKAEENHGMNPDPKLSKSEIEEKLGGDK